MSDQLALGYAAQDRGQTQVLASTAREWTEAAWTWIETMAATGVAFTTDELRRSVGDPPRNNALGAIVRRAQQAGLLRLVGFEPSARAVGRGRRVGIWAGAERA